MSVIIKADKWKFLHNDVPAPCNNYCMKEDIELVVPSQEEMGKLKEGDKVLIEVEIGKQEYKSKTGLAILTFKDPFDYPVVAILKEEGKKGLPEPLNKEGSTWGDMVERVNWVLEHIKKGAK